MNSSVLVFFINNCREEEEIWNIIYVVVVFKLSTLELRASSDGPMAPKVVYSRKFEYLESSSYLNVKLIVCEPKRQTVF